MPLLPKVQTIQPPANMQILGLISVVNRTRYSTETRHNQITDTGTVLALQAVQDSGNHDAEVYGASFLIANDDIGRPDFMSGYGTVCIPCTDKQIVEDGDFGLTVEELEAKYGPSEHPDYIREEWRYDVGKGDTNLGYWEWVLHQVENHYGDACDKCGKEQCDKVYVPDLGFICGKCVTDDENISV